MGLIDTVRTLTEVPTLLALKKGMEPKPLEHRDCYGAQVQRNAELYGDRTAMIFEGQQVTWGEFNELVNRYAHSFAGKGLQRGDTASVIMENRIEFLAVIVALNKLGVTGALINTNLRGRPLQHCISVTNSKACIFGEELGDALNEVKTELDLKEGDDYLFVPDAGTAPAPNWATDLNSLSESASSDNPATTDEVTLGDNAWYIFTSGTTGQPNAASRSNRRFLTSSGLSAQAQLRSTPDARRQEPASARRAERPWSLSRPAHCRLLCWDMPTAGTRPRDTWRPRMDASEQ